MKLAIDLVESGRVPDTLTRAGIRRLLRARLAELDVEDVEARRRTQQLFIDQLRRSPVAVHTEDANRQHYELPAEFFETVLGRHLKYSACWWPEDVDDLDEAEAATLEMTCRRARVEDGMEVLDLGCGWGSLSLHIAHTFPASRVLAVSNSRTQGEFIRRRAAARDLPNIEVVTDDMNTFEPDRRFDRVVSVEMFEHLRNWEVMFDRVSSWLEPEGRFFMHVFCHREHAYPYEVRSAADWMSEHFFTGGMMPSDDLPLRIGGALEVADHWRLNGVHYTRTLDAWLARMDHNRDRLRPLFEQTYGADARRWFQRWRLFFLACSELFAYHGGNEWYVSHYRLAPRSSAARRTVVPLIRRAGGEAAP